MTHRFIFRIGLPKCGTNSTVFANHLGITFLGKPYDADSPYRKIIERIIEQQPWDNAICKELFEQHIGPLPEDKPIVISDARLSLPLNGLSEILPDRLKYIFGDCRIFLTVRDQLSYVKSLYVQHIGTDKTAMSIDEWLTSNWGTGRRLKEYLAYGDIYDRYSAVFGEENIYVNLLEDLRSDTSGFAHRLSDFMGIDGNETARLFEGKARNTRPSRLQNRLLRYPRLYTTIRRASKLLPAPFFNLASRITNHDTAFDPVLSPANLHMIETHSIQTNRRLVERTGLSLSGFNYPL